MKIRLLHGLPTVSMELRYRNQQVVLDNVLLDTGSASSVLSADQLLTIGLIYEPTDHIHRIRGVGGSEFVFTKQIDRLSLENLVVEDFPVEVGARQYGFHLNGILGMDFLASVGAVIDLSQMDLRAAH